MTDEKLNPDAYEQLYLLNIESQRKMSLYDVENFYISAKEKVATQQDLLSITNLLRKYNEYFLSYEPIARRLDKMGKTQLSKRLEEILIDTRETLAIFSKLNQDLLYPDNKTHKDVLPFGEYGKDINKDENNG